MVLLAVIICKALYFTGKLVGKGSSLPGKIVLRLFPDILERLKLPETVVAVTGSNGKTSTTELIVHALKAGGLSVCSNLEGSNQTEGIATLLLRSATLGGLVKRDAIVMECDERYARMIFDKVKPSVLLVTNLCRDQLTRNGHHEFISDCLHTAILAAGEGVRLVLNTDDPFVAALAKSLETDIGNVMWFGVRDAKIASQYVDIKQYAGVSQHADTLQHADTPQHADASQHTGMYDDTAFCPVCKERMMYSYRIAGHYGSYSCTACGLVRSEPQVEAAMGEGGSLVFGDGVKMNMKFPGVTSAYNFCAAVAAAKASGVVVSDSVRALDGIELTGGRTLRLSLAGREGLLLVSKHENSFAYDCSLSWIVGQQKSCTVLVLVDAISRKYYTSETSWLWDIDFDILADDNVQKIVLAGRYVNELAARFAMTEVNQTKISYIDGLSGLRDHIEKNTAGTLYAVTCFSDKAKLLKEFA